MTFIGRIMSLYPLAHIFAIGWAFIKFLKAPSLFSFSLILFFLYIAPPVIFRIHRLIFGQNKRALFDLSQKKYSSWWGGHQIQLIFTAFPALEAFLRLIPGCYSLWLRIWGSQVGKNVYWTPLVEISDRDLLEIGNYVIIGHKAGFYAHVVNPSKGRMLVYTSKIKVGEGVFIGAGTRLGPGVKIESEAVLPVLSDIYINQRVKDDTISH